MGKSKPRRKQLGPLDVFDTQNAEFMPDMISVGDDEHRPAKIKKAFVAYSRLFAMRLSGDILGLYLEDDGNFSLVAQFDKDWIDDLETVVDETCLGLVQREYAI